MEIRKKHIYFMACAILSAYAVIVSFVLVRNSFENNEDPCDGRCYTCNLLAENDSLRRKLHVQQKLAFDCAQRFLQHHWTGKRDQEEYESEEVDGPEKQDEKIDFHEFLVQEIFAPDSSHTEQRK
jgi:hypothetical protein